MKANLTLDHILADARKLSDHDLAVAAAALLHVASRQPPAVRSLFVSLATELAAVTDRRDLAFLAQFADLAELDCANFVPALAFEHEPIG